jgi:hypothetical protein
MMLRAEIGEQRKGLPTTAGKLKHHLSSRALRSLGSGLGTFFQSGYGEEVVDAIILLAFPPL